MTGVANTFVVHKKKKVKGKYVLPKYVVDEEITLEDGSKVFVKKGTQYVDGWWQKLRKVLKGSSKLDTRCVIEHVRVAQWRTWHRDKDLWLEAGKTIQRIAYIPA